MKQSAAKHQVTTDAVVTQNQPGGIIALLAQTQQILVQAHRQSEFAAMRVIGRLPIRNAQEFRWGAELLPQLSRAAISIAPPVSGAA